MARQQRGPLAEGRKLVLNLRSLHTASAPPTLLHNVMEHIGQGDQYALTQTPIGSLFVAYNDAGLSAIRQAASSAEFERSFRTRFLRPIRQITALPEQLSIAIQQKLSGTVLVDLKFDLRGLTEFERDVLLKALEIPRGEVRPYAWIAREIGRPKAVRAVGTALGNNPIPLLIPCHRVVRSDYTIGDYIFGSGNKRTVLDTEGAAPEVLERLARTGVRFLGDYADGMFCLPSCGGMHLHTKPTHIKLHSVDEATAAGLVPCGNCRPAIRG